MARKINTLSEQDLETLAEVYSKANAKVPTAKPHPGYWKPSLGEQQAVAFNARTMVMLAHGERFSGKCIQTNAIVYTENGLRRLSSLKDFRGSVQTFDEVNSKHLFGPVSEYYSEPNRTAKNILFDDGSEFKTSPIHPLWVVDEKGEFNWVSSNEIQEGLKLGKEYWTPTVEHKNLLPGEPISYEGVVITENVAYLLGAMIGDGSMSFAKKHIVAFTNTDPVCIEAVRVAVEELGCRLVQRKELITYGIVGDQRFRKMIISMGLDVTSYFKHIPDIIIESPRNIIVAFLQGLYDTDGTVEKTGTVSFTSTSERLIDDTKQLLQALGVLGIKRFRKSASGRPTWDLTSMGEHAWEFGQRVGFRITRKQARLVQKDYHAHRHGLPFPAKKAIRDSWGRYISTHKLNREFHYKNRRLLQVKDVPCFRKFVESCEFTGEAHENYRISKTWIKLVSVTDCEADLADLVMGAHPSFVANGIINHNTYGVGHKLIRHAWSFHNARVLIVTGVKRQATAGGIWSKLINDILPEWKANLEGFSYSEPRQTAEKDTICEITNKFGTTSILHLISIPHGSSLQNRIKGVEMSAVFVDELTDIGGDEYFHALFEQIGRLAHIPISDQFYIGACNPAGPSHWVHKMFWGYTDDEGTFHEPFPDSVAIHHPISGNPSPRAQEYYQRVVVPSTKSDPIQFQRMVQGIWIDRPSGESIFGSDYVPEIHLCGDALSVPHPNPNFPLDVGYDLGDVNHAVVWLQQRFTKDKTIWVVLDELVSTGKKLSMEDLTPRILATMQFWCEQEEKSLTFTHISDKAAFDRYRSASGSYDNKQVEEISRKLLANYSYLKQPIRMLPCSKPDGSVAGRIKLLRGLLSRQEILISARCKHVIAALTLLESKKGDPFVPVRSEHLHVYDALTYPLFYHNLEGPSVEQTPGITPTVSKFG
jgi:hypothetical protein